jgi:hypothetical protein
MAVWIEHERSIVGWAVVFPYARNTIVPPACRKSCSMKLVHSLTRTDVECYMEWTRGRFARVNVEHCAPIRSEAYGLFAFVDQWQSQRFKYLLVEFLAPRKILHTKTNMGELHDGDRSTIVTSRNQSTVHHMTNAPQRRLSAERLPPATNVMDEILTPRGVGAPLILRPAFRALN